MIAMPALGLSVSYTTGGSQGSVSFSSIYNLDDSSSLQQQAVLAEGGIAQTSQASGSGNNTIEGSVGGNGYSVNNEVDSSGSMGVSTTAAGTGSGAGISQSTVLSGKSGSLSFVASSGENTMAVDSSFSGTSSMNTDLNAVAADRATMTGTATVAGVPVLESGDLEQVASGETGMSVDGLYAQPSGNLGQLRLNAVNVKNTPASGSSNYQLTGPAYTSTGGNKNAYFLTGWRWNTINPQITWYLKSNSVPSNLNVQKVASAVTNAANLWNGASNQKLYNPTVYSTPNVNIDTYDHKNVVAWKYLSDAPTALAYSRTWYSYSKVGGYYSAVESDISLNTRYPWSTSLKDGTPYTSGSSIDVQTVLTHEMGHTLGLGDVYGTKYASDSSEIMNAYSKVKDELGNGDKTGIWTLYH